MLALFNEVGYNYVTESEKTSHIATKFPIHNYVIYLLFCAYCTHSVLNSLGFFTYMVKLKPVRICDT